MLEKDCWLCSERFETTKMLKNNLSGSTHHQMEVICPWCPHNSIRYRRVTELKEHDGRVHKEILKELRPDILSEGNGYYVSQHPGAYRRVVRPASAFSRQAREMKTTMRAWLSHTKKTFLSVKDWEAEWTVGTRLMVLLERKHLLRFTLGMRQKGG